MTSEMEETLLQNVATITQQIATIEKTVDRLDKRIEKVPEIESGISKINDHIAMIHETQAAHGKRMDLFEERLHKQEMAEGEKAKGQINHIWQYVATALAGAIMSQSGNIIHALELQGVK